MTSPIQFTLFHSVPESLAWTLDDMEGKVDDEETKRLKRLELNKKAAQESRKRKKIKIEELQRSVVYLTSENNGLREQNEMLRMMLSQEEPAPGGDGAAAADATPMAQRWLAFVKVQLILT